MKKKNSFAGAVVLLLSSTFFLLFAVGMIFLPRYGEDAPPLGFAIMFFIFGALMLFGGISEILLIKGEELIKKEGYYKIAKFVSYKLGKEIGTQTTNARYYSISYSYLDVDGEITAKSRPIYTMDEVKYFLDKK